MPTLTGPNSTPVNIQVGSQIGKLVHKTTQGLEVEVKESDAQSQWELTATGKTNIANLGKLKDIIVVFGYTVS